MLLPQNNGAWESLAKDSNNREFSMTVLFLNVFINTDANPQYGV